MKDLIDLGHQHFLEFFCWKPDRALNPQFDGIPDIEKAGVRIEHPSKRSPGSCVAVIIFKSQATETVFKNRNQWTVESWEPLTVSPSVLCTCGDHGFIRDGKWVPA